MTCPVCSSTDSSVHGDLRHCAACDHVYQWPPTITASYNASYIVKYHTCPTVQMSHLRVGFVRAVAPWAVRVLDYGHGLGDFVRVARAAGLEAFGFDVHGVDVGVPTVRDIARDWHVVTFFDSLEHVADLDKIRDLASRTRTIVVSLPCRPGDFPGGAAWKHQRGGEHLHYFNGRSLQRLFRGHELRQATNVEDTVRGPGPGGSWNIGTYVFERAA